MGLGPSGPILPLSCPRCNKAILDGGTDQKAVYIYIKKLSLDEYKQCAANQDPLSPWIQNYLIDSEKLQYLACEECMETRIPREFRHLFQRDDNLLHRSK